MKKAVKKAHRKSANGRRTKKPTTAAQRKRKAASRKARTVKRHVAVLAVAKMDTSALQKHVRGLCRAWRKEERELDHAFEADNRKAIHTHERNMERLEREMRRVFRAVDAFPVHVDY